MFGVFEEECRVRVAQAKCMRQIAGGELRQIIWSRVNIVNPLIGLQIIFIRLMNLFNVNLSQKIDLLKL